MQHAKTNLAYLDPVSNEKIIPYVIEPSVGVERLFYATIVDKYEIEKLPEGETREVLKLPYCLAPYKLAVLPLTNKLNEPAQKIYSALKEQSLEVTYDTSGSIGKRYRRQDAIGTPYCLTYDFESQEKQTVTIRHRDSMKQERINIKDVQAFLHKAIN
jgi:glycyl-tRNA synthetase